MAERRSDSARSAQEAALETRPEKQQVDLGQLVLVPLPSHALNRLTSAEESVTDVNESEAVLELALPLPEEAAQGSVEGVTGDADPLAAIQDAVNRRGFDEIILSTLPTRVSRWLKLDLPNKVQGLGLPVTHVEARPPPPRHT